MKILLQIAALGLVLTANAQGTSEAVLNFSGSVPASLSDTVGWTFQPVNSMSVTGLGAFNYIFAGQSSVQVGLWDANGTLLRSNTITASSAQNNLSRYESITPVLLVPGQVYHLGVYAPLTGTIQLQVVAPDFGTVNLSPDIQLRGSAQSGLGTGFAFPAETPPPPPDGIIYLGPNFRYNFVPEPSAFALLGLGVLAATCFRRKR